MFQSGGMALKLSSWALWLAQVPVNPDIDTAEDAALVFSGPQFLTALIAGVLLAFGIQLLLTNLSVAAGISYLGHQSDSDNTHDDKGGSVGGTIRKISTGVGIWTLITVTIALFLGCLLAVKLSLLESAGLGAIVGLVIWATYFSLLFWVSSTTVGSLIGSVVNAATSGFQAIVGTAAAAIGGGAASRQVVATAEAAASAVRREFSSAIDPVSLRENVEDYIQALRPPELNIQSIRQEFENLLNDPNLKQIAGSDHLRNIDRQTFVDLISSRSDLSKRDINRLADQLEGAWKKTVNQLPTPQGDPMAGFSDFIRSATPDQLVGNQFTQKLEELISEVRQLRQSGLPGQSSSGDQAQKSTGPVAQAMTMGVNSLIGMVMGRTDLSDFDVEKIVGQLKTVRDQAGDQAGKIASQVNPNTPALPPSTVRTDVENYLLNTPIWQLKGERVERDFRDVLYDPEADPEVVAQELEQLNRSDFADVLQQRGLLTQDEIRSLSTQLELIRLEVLNTARAAQERGRSLAILRQVEQYLLTTPKQDLTPEKIQLNLTPILEDSDADFGQLSNRLAQFDRSTFAQTLSQRGDITQEDADVILPQLETARDRALRESQELQEAAKAQAEAQWLKVQSLLRDTGKAELNPDHINRELQMLLDNPQAGLAALRSRASRFDRDTLVQLLNQRQDLSEDQINRTLDQIEGAWTRISYTPQKLAGKAKEQYDQATSTIANYLRSTGKSELNPEGIQRDLSRLLNDPKGGALAIRGRLASMDRDTLVKLLSQRQDLSEEQVNQIIDQVQSTIRDIVKAPRRLARRTQQQVQDFQGAIADYLRSTGKDELNPEGIKRDVQLLLNDPRAGVSSLSDRLAHFDRSTLVSLLSQREDISEQDVNRIVDNILGVRDQVMSQLRDLQLSIQSVVDRIFAKIRNYLNSLERPELNYDGIKTDLRKLFDDPQAGFDAMRDRLSQFDRNTLVAIVSSREDISEADANRVIDQIERTRNSVLHRAERIQTEAQRRLDEVKYQAQKQAEETRKAAASAAWWLFWTALVSGAASAIAGAVAVAG
ncbi:MFS transporter [Microcoleus sp. FACHB-SPT15]|uniref:MFS transporter n=1 Tax=Microcoleus sp. FACHB-SPT15 TaxID=2692830 RepID=UPI00177F568E|nr:MFS transporter [Microcoleus sp. FACHB-SPT15]MBD1804361.1 MFS transporter [Microcoleus sp. FACHB-SPT15]